MEELAEKLRNNRLYQKELEKLISYESNRIFCKHDLTHFKEVARIATVVARQNQLFISVSEIEITALLHDMGRVKQYEKGISHEKAGVAFAREILFSLGCDKKMVHRVCHAIAQHSQRQNVQLRMANVHKIQELGELISYADQFSRTCYCCNAKKECKWKEEEKIKKAYYGGSA